PASGTVFLSIKDADKNEIMAEAARTVADLGFHLLATRGTAKWLGTLGLEAEVINKVYEGRPDIVDRLKDGGVQLIFNTTEGAQAIEDSREIRSVALYDKIPYYTTAAGSRAAARAMLDRVEGVLGVMSLQG
ncbi:MAG: carbamoyl phosphate synthase large subunit, partial [Pseudomonadota bacterium]